MLVRKFEAQSIKKAIDMVKIELGPEAIILSAKENEKSFGLGGESSVEVTAAISESKLREKQMAEKKLNNKAKAHFLNSSAKTQKDFIEKSLELLMAERAGVEEKNSFDEEEAIEEVEEAKGVRVTPISYVDIPDEIPRRGNSYSQTVQKSAQPKLSVKKTPSVIPSSVQFTGSTEVDSLRSEVSYLKGLLEKFQNIPQNVVSSHPGAEEGISYELSFAYEKLIESGLNKENVKSIITAAEEALPKEQKRKKAFVEGWLIKYFLDHTEVSNESVSDRYHIFLGPTGQGKTTTIIKLAAHLLLNEKKKVAILSGDSVKVGAGVQLKTYAQMLNVPFGTLEGNVDWVALDEQLADVDHILIDTAGSTLKSTDDVERIQECIPKLTDTSIDYHYVQSIMTRDLDAFEVADRYRIFNFSDVVFTRLDEAIQFGMIYNFQERYDVPVHSFGIGSGMPEGFELATRERIVDLLFHLSKPMSERGSK